MILKQARFSFILLMTFLIVNQSFAGPTNISQFIKIDQFGYKLSGQKIAVISDPQVGYNAALSFTPSNNYQIRDWNTDAVLFSGVPIAWNGGATHTQSGDKVWHFDFSTVTISGSYYVYDVGNNVGSYRFEISDCVYEEVLKAACRTNFYQRCGVAKALPHAGASWTDVACHVGANQDTDCRLWSAPSDASTSKDLSGGWHNGADYNKYVNEAWHPVLHLLLAYEEAPTAWKDDFNIPESGNGIPDVLDEVKVELDWLLKMQQADGSVLSLVGTNDYESSSPPSNDAINDFRRFYGQATTQASYSAAGMFALAAIQFESIGLLVYASQLENAAVNAWNWAEANPGITFYNNNQDAAVGPINELGGGDQEGWSGLVNQKKLVAAVYLFAITENATYKPFIDSEANITNLNFHGSDAIYIVLNDALLYYGKLSGATVSVKNQIRNYYSSSLEAGMNNLPTFLADEDAYRAYITRFNWDTLSFDSEYDWGSNYLKSRQGITYQNMNVYGLNIANSVNYTNAASAYLHYFHGVNPLSKIYLSNMIDLGGENSIQTFYHNWFSEGTIWDTISATTPGPAPGFSVLGPNEFYEIYTCCATNCETNCSEVENMLADPAQKCYQDENLWYPFSPWAFAANELNLQATYIRLLSKFCATNCSPASLSENQQDPGFTFYPNPSSETITIQLTTKEETTLEIYNSIGAIVRESNITHQSKVDVSELSSGIYFLRLKDKGTLLMKKL